ncbi:hypothetical protein FJTKL_10231 [Diaporthe vaccinii]|uniref:Secreted protein n=1 Tax=Diaporthe vaccinii TaxID=105482 RepID=A0ABR4EL13_9PEZI
MNYKMLPRSLVWLSCIGVVVVKPKGLIRCSAFVLKLQPVLVVLQEAVTPSLLASHHLLSQIAPATPSAFAAMYEPTHLPVILEATLLLHNSPPTSTGPRHPDNISFPPSRFSQPIRSSLL